MNSTEYTHSVLYHAYLRITETILKAFFSLAILFFLSSTEVPRQPWKDKVYIKTNQQKNAHNSTL